ncbi:hypothetical protein DMB41_16295 [Pectobacterium carotovorum subsp. carotovorum]|nr:hypothetical protein DMB41_16295 [Pectobacterium carotovorum subsp. carotovorum]
MQITGIVNGDELGHVDGDICRRMGCKGVIAERQVDNCSCHMHAPCPECVENRHYCPLCGWEAKDDLVVNDYVVNVDRKTGVYRMWTPRPLDRSKIDYRIIPHTNASQICEGVFPIGTPISEVLAVVKGTFGGRFQKFDDNRGEFRYVAYTD